MLLLQILEQTCRATAVRVHMQVDPKRPRSERRHNAPVIVVEVVRSGTH